LTDYTNLKAELTNTLNAYLLMEAEAMVVDNGELDSQLLAISTNFNAIEQWIEEKEGQTLLAEFLTAQKALMQEYGLVIDVVAVEPGYGEVWGGNESAIRFSIDKDGLTAVKVFDTISVSESDL
jgi:hypothetical protein